MRTTLATIRAATLPAAEDQPQTDAGSAPAVPMRRDDGRIAARDRRERLGRRASVLPLRCHEPYAANALDRPHDVQPAADRPPPVPGLLHEGEALQPDRLAEGRRIAPEPTAVQLEPEELQPVPEPQQADELSAPRVLGPPPAEPALETPEAQRIEAGDHDLPFGHQHSLGFAQDLVRILAELEDVRKDDEVDALRSERQVSRVCDHRATRFLTGGEAKRDAVGAQKVERRQADLQRLEAEHVLDRAVELRTLPLEDVRALRGLEPLGQIRFLRRLQQESVLVSRFRRLQRSALWRKDANRVSPIDDTRSISARQRIRLDPPFWPPVPSVRLSGDS